MKIYRSNDGGTRIWYDDGEIEMVVESDLRRSGFYPTVDNPVVDLEGFIEEHLRASLDQYAELGPDVLGQTEFGRGCPPNVRINRSLTKEAIDGAPNASLGILGRWRATVAHESTHIILHRQLFERCESQQSLFDDTQESASTERVQCLKRDVTYSNTGDWREFQANRGMAALLMPRELFTKIAHEHCDLLGFNPLGLTAEDENTYKLAFGLAKVFVVSRQAALIRLQTLGIVCSPGQTSFINARNDSGGV